ncbi:hypothetical protein PIB30_062735 [Stylosanthes scabra]|uniref:Uncharacterized protein n=1 Tax=Stylosanthes scabra TaxID=79078 RepID=A0ABU6YLW5_9FABA|nr:hypothetical protein [Stylosanthes scabra]
MDIAHCYLHGNADAMEFCPHDSYHHILAASTYNLQEGDRPSRHGSISLFNVDGSNIDGGDDKLDLVYSVETSGIFDIKWSPPAQYSHPFLSQADADGYLRIHMLDSSCNGVEGYYGDSEEEFEGKYEIDDANEEDVLEHDMESDVEDVANALANELPFQEPSFMRVLDEEALKAP